MTRPLLLVASACSVALLLRMPQAQAVDVLMRAPAADISLATALKLTETQPTCSDRWVRVGQLSDGPKELVALIQHAAHPFQTGMGNSVIVEAMNSRPREQHIALCSVRFINDVAGPPEDCSTVLIISPNMTLFRIAQSTCHGWAGSRIDGNTIDIEYDVDTPLEPIAFVNPLSQLLRDDLKLSMQLETTKAKDGAITSLWLRSTSGFRDSIILQPGWRDTLNFDVLVSRDDKRVYVQGSTWALVSRTASGHQLELNPPDTSQKTTYATTLNKKVHDALVQACAKVTEVDDKHFICE